MGNDFKKKCTQEKSQTWWLFRLCAAPTQWCKTQADFMHQHRIFFCRQFGHSCCSHVHFTARDSPLEMHSHCLKYHTNVCVCADEVQVLSHPSFRCISPGQQENGAVVHFIVGIRMAIQLVRPEQSLYNSNKLDSQYLVWAPLFFNTVWTLSDTFLVISLSSLQE